MSFCFLIRCSFCIFKFDRIFLRTLVSRQLPNKCKRNANNFLKWIDESRNFTNTGCVDDMLLFLCAFYCFPSGLKYTYACIFKTQKKKKNGKNTHTHTKTPSKRFSACAFHRHIDSCICFLFLQCCLLL